MSTTSVAESDLIIGLDIIWWHSNTCHNIINEEKPIGAFSIGDVTYTFHEDAERWVSRISELTARQTLETFHDVKSRWICRHCRTNTWRISVRDGCELNFIADVCRL